MANFCVLFSVGVDNTKTNPNIIFTIKDSKLCVPVVTLSAKEIKKLTKFGTKGFDLNISLLE